MKDIQRLQFAIKSQFKNIQSWVHTFIVFLNIILNNDKHHYLSIG
jgi:hypothetical protein